MRYCLLSSTGGAVARRVWREDARFRAALALVVSDRPCGAAEFARENSIPLVMIEERDGLSFSNRLAATLRDNAIDYTFCFFTRLLRGPICLELGHRIYNFHPSLLPACPGMHGFEDSVASGALFIGSTVHVVNEVVDGGRIIQQSAASSRVTNGDHKAMRHRIYNQQCAQLLQVFVWTEAGRIECGGGGINVIGADYSGNSMNIPAFEDEECLRMHAGQTL